MVKITQNSFLGGMLDFEMMGRQDVARYAKGATLLKNFIPLKRGAIRKRPGTDFKAAFELTDLPVSGNTEAPRLVPFAYTEEEGWALIFYNGGFKAVRGTDGTVVNGTKDGSATWLTGDQVAEFDYCQSGDMMFIAHQTHEPCRIEHTVTTSGNTVTHAFKLKTMPLAMPTQGVPTITGSEVVKQKMVDIGSLVTEEYVATAVYDDDIETVPSAVYAQIGNVGDDASAEWEDYKQMCVNLSTANKTIPYQFQPCHCHYSGSTSYHAPWTESQTITLRVKAPGRTNAVTGTIEYPRQLRIYRKTGGVFGLVGTVELTSHTDTIPNTQPSDIWYPTTAGGDALAVAYDNETYGRSISAGDVYRTNAAMEVTRPASPSKTSGAYTAVLRRSTQRVKIELWVGKVTETPISAIETVEERRIQGVTLSLTPCTHSRLQVRVGSVSTDIDDTLQSSDLSFSYFVGYSATRAELVNGSYRITGEEDIEDETYEEMLVRAYNDFAQNRTNGQLEAKTVSVASTGTEISIYFPPSGGDTEWFSGIRITDETRQQPAVNTYTWTDRYYTPDTSVTPPDGSWDGFGTSAGEYPGAVCISQQRLIWASTKNEPGRVVMSHIGNFYSYIPHKVMVPDDPIDFQTAATRFPKANFLVELRHLLMFNAASEWVIASASAASAMTYETIEARPHSFIGSAPWLKPAICNNLIIFAERTGKAVRQYGYQLDDNGYGGTDISIFSSSIFADKKIVAWAYQQHPNSTLWCVLSDGTMCSLTFIPEQNAIAWATHATGADVRGADVCGVCCTAAIRGNGNAVAGTSEVMLLVRRYKPVTSDGVTTYVQYWTVERMRTDCKHGGDTAANAVCMDSIGNPNAPEDVCGIRGYRFASEFQSVYPVVQNAVGLAQMDVKCVQHAHLRMADAIGGTVRGAGVPEAQASELVETAFSGSTPQSPSDSVTLPTIDENVVLTTADERDGRVFVKQNQPWPFTLLLLETDVECEDGGGGMPGRRAAAQAEEE